MNPGFLDVIRAREEDRRDLFMGTALRLGTAVQYIEKDFWACWILDVLFNGLPAGGPRLLFKGGTSLSKAFGLISRFSEDIDITVFREDLGIAEGTETLLLLGTNARRRRLDAIKRACQGYINGDFRAEIGARLAEAAAAAGLPAGCFRLSRDKADPDGQTLLFEYPGVVAAEGYVRSSIKIEAGAKSALVPHASRCIQPYIAADLQGADLRVCHVTTVLPERTFWDKVILLHGLRQWHDRRGELRQGGQRVSRHYYDVFCLLAADTDAVWRSNQVLAQDCAAHARLFFDMAGLGLDKARHGSYTLMPSGRMMDSVIRDYEAMAGMIFGRVPALEAVLAEVRQLQEQLNK